MTDRVDQIIGHGQTPLLPPPLNPRASHQPITPDIRPELHINILIPSMTLGGAERSVHDILTGLKQRNPSVKLFLLYHVSPSYPIEDTERFRVFQMGNLPHCRKLQTVALEVLASPSPVLYTHLVHVKDLYPLWSTGVITIPVIQNSQPAWQDPPSAFDHPNVPFIVAVSEDVARQLREAGCPKPVVVIRHELQRWYSLEELQSSRDTIRRQYGIDKNTLLIGMVGQFKAQKAYPRAVRILQKVQQFQPAKLMILGGWDHEYGSGRATYTATCRQALELGVIPDVIMPGAVNPVEPYYAAFDIFLNTSVYEGLSVATLEAIQSGCPVVTADAGGNREVLPTNGALIEDASDIDAYVEAIWQMAGRTERIVPKQPAEDAHLVPRLWCLLSRYGLPERTTRTSNRSGTLFLTDNLNIGGPQRSLTNLLCHLPSSHKAFLCVLDNIGCEDYLKAIEGKGHSVFSLCNVRGLLGKTERILCMMENLNVRTLCFWNLDARIKLFLAKVLELRSIRLIDVSPGPMLFDELDQVTEFQRRVSLTADQYFQRLDHFVAKYSGGGPSQASANITNMVVTIPNGVPSLPDRMPNLPGPTLLPASFKSRLTIGTCCRIVPSKHLEFLIDMMTELTERVPGVSLTIVGGVDPHHVPYWNTVAARLEATGLTNIYFAGAHADVRPFLRQFKVFVMISDDQGCPNASLEAMAIGLPIVANPSGGTVDQVVPGVNGFLVSDEDPCDMARQVEFLLKNAKTRRAFGRASARIARRKFTMKRMVDGYMKLLDRP